MSQRYIGGLIYNPPGGFSGYFGASSTDMLSAASNAAFAFGTGDFTIEAFVLATTSQTDNWIVGLHNNCWLRVGSGGALEFYNSVGSSSVIAGSAMPTNQWVHVAAVRSGTTLTIYQNGTSVASGTVSSNFSTSVACTIGNQSGFDRRWNGYISNVRVVKGTAVYTSAFTPPNGPLQAITNTSLLTCAYPTFRDGSSNNFTITVNGNTAVSTQNPFPLTQLPNPALGNQGNGVYSISQYQALRSQNLWPAIDPYFDYVTLMLHGNGTNGAQNNTFLDSSTNNFTITRNGNTTQGTFTPYGSNWSNYCTSSSGFLSIGSSAALASNTNSFTLEFWYNSTATGNGRPLGNGTGGGYGANNWVFGSNNTAGKLEFFVYNYNTGTAMFSSTSSTVSSDGQWHHIVLVRSGTTWAFFIDGQRQGSTITSSVSFNGTSSALNIGWSNVSGDVTGFAGYLSNVRFVNGTAVYDPTQTTLTVPSGPLTAITNTSVLTCQSNRFIDNSSNAFAITVSGSPSVQRFSPFNPTTPYAAGTIGGSGYFDGSGDYLSAATNTAFNCGTGNFTIEAWVNIANYPGSYPLIIGNNNGSFSAGALALTAQNSTSGGASKISLAAYDINSGAVTLAAGATNTLNSWIHVALVRNGTSLVLYINGASSASTTISAGVTFDWGKSGLLVGGGNWDGANSYFAGYINDLRLVKGTAVYTATFTPPTAPLTAITNTSLLLNFTNGGIIDNAMMNDLETVGNAQISTSVSKFGGGSLAFDGTGDWLFAPSSPNFALLTGDFTIEMWAYFNNTASTAFFDMRGVGGGSPNNPVFTWSATASTVQAYLNDGYRITSGTLSTGQWYHIALVRSGTTATMYINGVSAGTYTYSTSVAQQALYVGTGYGLGSWNGNIDDLRITKYARYTANFTPQRSQWQDQ